MSRDVTLVRNTTLIGIILLLVIPFDSNGRPATADNLKEGITWTLSVNAETHEMIIGSGKETRRDDGSFYLKHKMQWGGREGGIQALSQPRNSKLNIKLYVTARNGEKIGCEGLVGMGTSSMMAGTCGGKEVSGAWYAVRKESRVEKTPSRSDRRRDNDKREPVISIQQYNEMKKQRDEMVAMLQDARNSSVYYSNKLAECNKASKSQGLTTRSLNTFDQRITTKYVPQSKSTKKLTAAQQGAIDSTSSSEFPDLSASVQRQYEIDYWLNDVKSNSRSIAQGILPSEDRKYFNEFERSRCNQNIFCEIVLYQKIISCALGLGGCQ